LTLNPGPCFQTLNPSLFNPYSPNPESSLAHVLKKQKIHMEAARMLQFAEEDFMKTLDAHN